MIEKQTIFSSLILACKSIKLNESSLILIVFLDMLVRYKLSYSYTIHSFESTPSHNNTAKYKDGTEDEDGARINRLHRRFRCHITVVVI